MLAMILPACTFGQTVYEGQVINAETEEGLMYATVTLLKTKHATSSNYQGYFRLIADYTMTNDTIVVSHVGFKTFRLPVSGYQPNIFIKLEPTSGQLAEVTVGATKVKKAVIEKFNHSDVKDLRGGAFYPTYPYNIVGSFAKEFEAPVAGTLLSVIHLGRRAAYDIPFSMMDFPRTSSNKLTRFLLHVMTHDSLSGAPVKRLFTKVVTLNDNALRITFDLTKERIVIPDKKFFIAIEWLLTPINEIVQLDIGEKVAGVKKDNSTSFEEGSRYRIIYQPILVILPQWTGSSWQPRLSKVPIWNSKDGLKWTQVPRAYDVALSATLTY